MELVSTVVIGDLQKYRSSGNVLLYAADNFNRIAAKFRDLPKNELDPMVYVDSFLADHYREQSNRYYPLTASFANIVQSVAPVGLYYPSVKAGGGINIAIPSNIFHSSFEVFCTKVLKIRESYGHGAFSFDTSDGAWQFGEDGAIDWADGALPPQIPAGHGWRGPNL